MPSPHAQQLNLEKQVISGMFSKTRTLLETSNGASMVNLLLGVIPAYSCSATTYSIVCMANGPCATVERLLCNGLHLHTFVKYSGV